MSSNCHWKYIEQQIKIQNSGTRTKVEGMQWRIQDFPEGDANLQGGGANLLFG